jgi:hypothetical protein
LKDIKEPRLFERYVILMDHHRIYGADRAYFYNFLVKAYNLKYKTHNVGLY